MRDEPEADSGIFTGVWWGCVTQREPSCSKWGADPTAEAAGPQLFHTGILFSFCPPPLESIHSQAYLTQSSGAMSINKLFLTQMWFCPMVQAVGSAPQDIPTHFWACFCHYVTLHTTLAAGPRKFEPSPQSNWFQWRAPARIQTQTSCCCFLAVSAWQAKIPDRFFNMDLSEHKWTPLTSHLNFIIPLPNNSWASRLPPG